MIEIQGKVHTLLEEISKSAATGGVVAAVLDTAVDEMVDRGVPRRTACQVVRRPRASHYRAKQDPIHGPPSPRPRSHRALKPAEVDEIITTLTSERFCDQAPAQVWATLLDDGTYLASVSTMYRGAAQNGHWSANDEPRPAVPPT